MATPNTRDVIDPLRPDTIASPGAGPTAGRGRVARVVHRTQLVVGDRTARIPLIVIGILAFLAVFGRFLWTQDPDAVSLGNALQAPSLSHPMGTDPNGRDVFARFNEAAGLSMSAGLVIVVAGAVIGSALGVLSGMLGGHVDMVMMRIMDALLAFPPLILAMAVTVGLGVGLVTASIGIVLTSIPWLARIIRAEVLAVRSRGYVLAAVAMGATTPHIVRRHIVPNVIATLPVMCAASYGYSILTLAALGFVGLGVQPPTAEWGTMITEGHEYIINGQWWISGFPGVAVLALVISTSLLADRLRDVLDPRGELTQL